MEPIIVVPYKKEWIVEFEDIGKLIRDNLGESAVRIDHIGSTSIKGLDAKPIIDIQISVRSLEPMNTYKQLLENIGFVHRNDNPDKTKRYFRETPGNNRTHIHVREVGSWPEQFALLFRDYLRNHEEDCRQYATLKYKLAELYNHKRDQYVEEKEPYIWEIMKKASKWSQEIGWKSEQTDI